MSGTGKLHSSVGCLLGFLTCSLSCYHCSVRIINLVTHPRILQAQELLFVSVAWLSRVTKKPKWEGERHITDKRTHRNKKKRTSVSSIDTAATIHSYTRAWEISKIAWQSAEDSASYRHVPSSKHHYIICQGRKRAVILRHVEVGAEFIQCFLVYVI